jgi:dethiobiotin synthetase
MNTPGRPARRIFITGTDTGAGKTILTGLLFAHAQSHGPARRSVAALKPFCSGARTDAELLFSMQRRKPGTSPLTLDEINPFYFPTPVAPARAAALAGRKIRLQEATKSILKIPADLLLIEGAGGLLAPLGNGFSALDLIEELSAEVLIAAPNRLGVINHTLLTLEALRHHGVSQIRIALIGVENVDGSSAFNRPDLLRLAKPCAVVPIPFLRDCRAESGCLSRAAQTMPTILGRLLAKSSGKHD